MEFVLLYLILLISLLTVPKNKRGKLHIYIGVSISEVNKGSLSNSDQQLLVKLSLPQSNYVFTALCQTSGFIFLIFFCSASSPSYCDYDGAINFITVLPEYKGRHMILSLKAKYLAQFRHLTQAASIRALWGGYYRVRGYDFTSFQISSCTNPVSLVLLVVIFSFT